MVSFNGGWKPNNWVHRNARQLGGAKSSNDPTNSRFRDGKIAEEWVNRDELGMLIELGVVKSSGR